MSYEWFFDVKGRMKVTMEEKKNKKGLITDITELEAKHVVLEAKVKNLELILKKLYADFYAKQK
ncbi:hypothetical protein [Solitalea canadensis]|uniref:hypothetical protein n=1 Tax=Solitalea canadensis TaxID=995 RepID=UPI00024718AB|nr:hypothetical protein [Solitalea canadensis]